MNRPIRSFVTRAGRITAAQERALHELWPRYGVDLQADAAALLRLPALFGREAACALEIGFGNGDYLLARALAEPQRDFLGIEVHRPGVGHLLLAAAKAGATNLRLICHDAVEVLPHIPPGALDEVLLLFPDPWPKTRHHKRRIVQPAFVQLVAERLRVGGRFQLATDWEPYAQEMLRVLHECALLRNGAADGGFASRPAGRAATRFEHRGRRLGHVVRDLQFERVAAPHRA
jgi:tRNA (guanine-N7-)-methyltransferase